MSKKRTITMWSAVALGIGSMVGAGVFALLGEAAAMAGSAVWLSFLAAGIIALLTGHSFAQLGIQYPSPGGIVEYLVRAYGSGWFAGGCSILFYIAQLIGLAMIALAFGKFTATFLGIENDLLFWNRALASTLILTLSALTLIGSKIIGKIQRIIVLANLALLATFTLALSSYSDSTRLVAETWPAASPIFGSLSLTFFAFTGFAVISNAAGSMANPTRDLPRAMYTTIAIVTVLYVCLAITVVGAVGEEELKSSGAILLAVAAKSAFGEVGYNLLLVSAIAATITCINGGLFGVTSITYALAENGQLPSHFKREIRASTRGLTISAAAALIMVNFMSLTTVASLGSATSLLVYTLVNFGALRLLKVPVWRKTLIVLSVIACASAIVIWLIFTLDTSPGSISIFLMFLVGAFLAEGLMQRFRKRRIRAQVDWKSPTE